MIEKHKKTFKYLNYVKHFFILASAVTGCVSISAFPSLACVPVGITSYGVGIKFVQSLQESKGISQLSNKIKRSMMK